MAESSVKRVYREAATRHGLVSRVVDSDPAIHALELEGEGSPSVLVHGGGGAAYVWLPLIDHLENRRLVAPDRPGFGLSGPIGYETGSFRAAAIRFIDNTLDAFGIAQADLVGSSIGGTWSLWYALERPDRVRRLVLAGAPPMLPGTRIPAPLRIMSIPGVGGLFNRIMKPSPRTVRQMMGSFGEGDTIGDHPDVIEAMVADHRDPETSAATVEETRAILTPVRGFRASLRVSEADLGRVTAPTMLVWGSQDPVGGPDVARQTADALPDARLEVIDAGHLPWLGHPQQVAGLIGDFL